MPLGVNEWEHARVIGAHNVHIFPHPQWQETVRQDDNGHQHVNITLRNGPPLPGTSHALPSTTSNCLKTNEFVEQRNHKDVSGLTMFGELDAVKCARMERKEENKRKKNQQRVEIEGIASDSAVFRGEDASEQTTLPQHRQRRASAPPTHFVAIQITNPIIICGINEVQREVVSKDSRLQPALIPLETLHITLLVMHLPEDISQINSACEALREGVESWQQSSPSPSLVLPLAGLSHFRNQVLFVDIEKGEALNNLVRLAGVVNAAFSDCGVVDGEKTGESSTFQPHVTVAKLSRMTGGAGSGRVRRIPPTVYERYVGTPGTFSFGSQHVDSVQLVEMRNRPRGGYYNCLYAVPLRGLHSAAAAGYKLPVPQLLDELLTYVDHFCNRRDPGSCEEEVARDVTDISHGYVSQNGMEENFKGGRRRCRKRYQKKKRGKDEAE